MTMQPMKSFQVEVVELENGVPKTGYNSTIKYMVLAMDYETVEKKMFALLKTKSYNINEIKDVGTVEPTSEGDIIKYYSR